MRFEKTFICATKEYSDFDKDVPAPYMRGVFALGDENIENAKIRITALGFYDLYVNGTRVTKGILAPYISNPDQVVVYDEYDIAALLKKGKNAIGLILGNGFTNNYGGVPWDIHLAKFRAAPKTAFCVEVNGKEVFSSVGKMKWAPSPILNDDYREGEYYDARREIVGWNLPDFDDSAWKEPLSATTPKGRCVLADFEPIREYKRRKAIRIIPLEDGYLYDFGVNTAGVPVLKINGKAGQTITLVVGEWFKDGNMDTKNIQCWVRYRDMDREIQMIRYICKGEQGEGFMPCFSYYGGRYVKVTGIEEAQATEDLVAFSEQSSALRRMGSFYCSDEYANKTFENTLRSDYSNFYYFPTDCPHREKSGWTGDVALSSEQLCLLLDCEKSLRMWLSCLRDCQKENGALPCIVPTGGWGYGWGSGPSWDSVIAFTPYMLYRYTGHKEILEENADTIYKYLGFLRSIRNDKGTIDYGLGDWCQIGALRDSDPWTPAEVTDTLNAIEFCRKSEKIFLILNQSGRAGEARALGDSLRQAARNNFVEWRYGDAYFCRPYCKTQTAQAMLIRNGIFEQEELPHAVDRMKEMLGGTENHMQVGVFGVQALLRVLCDYGMADVAYEAAMSPDRPSYGNMLDHGATSLWEFIHTFVPGTKYDVSVGKIKSMNHHFWGDIAAWYISYIAGLRINEELDDIYRVGVAPCFVKQLEYAEGRHEMPYGTVIADWQRVGDRKILMFVGLPEGAHGKLRLPQGYVAEEDTSLRGGGNRFHITKV